MSPAAFAIRLIDHGLAELAERAEAMALDRLKVELEEVSKAGRSAAADLVAGILDRELQRREREARQ